MSKLFLTGLLFRVTQDGREIDCARVVVADEEVVALASVDPRPDRVKCFAPAKADRSRWNIVLPGADGTLVVHPDDSSLYGLVRLPQKLPVREGVYCLRPDEVRVGMILRLFDVSRQQQVDRVWVRSVSDHYPSFEARSLDKSPGAGAEFAYLSTSWNVLRQEGRAVIAFIASVPTTASSGSRSSTEPRLKSPTWSADERVFLIPGMTSALLLWAGIIGL